MKWITLSVLATLVTSPVMAADCTPGSNRHSQAVALYQQSKQAKPPAEKAEYLRQALNLCEAPEPYYDLGKSYMRLGELDQALEVFDRALDLVPADDTRLRGKIHGRRAHVNLAMDRISLALADKDAALTLLGDTPPKWLNRLGKQIDLHPKRQHMSARDIALSLNAKRSMTNHKGFATAPSIDIFVTFEYASDQPDSAGSRQLGDLGEAMNAVLDDEIKKILVIGHTDVRGDANYNQALSERRAKTVVRYLADLYPKLANRLGSQGRGESEPAHQGDSEEDHRLNRRVEVQLISK